MSSHTVEDFYRLSYQNDFAELFIKSFRNELERNNFTDVTLISADEKHIKYKGKVLIENKNIKIHSCLFRETN